HGGRMLQGRAAFLITLIAINSPVTAQQLEPRAVPTRDVVSFAYQSPSMGVRFGINVGLPVDFHPVAGKKYPALITTDGDQVFVGVYDAARRLMSQTTIGEMFIVSIGSELDQDDSSWIRRRFYEFTPTGT